MHRKSRRVLFAAIVYIILCQNALADKTKEALDLITDTANKICGTVAAAGESQSMKVTGEVKAELQGLAKRLADLGISGSGLLENKSYVGVLQEELASALVSQRECKLKIFDKLEKKLVSPANNNTQDPVVALRKINVLGFWSGVVSCPHGANFSLSINFVQEVGSSAIGFSEWRGPTRGTDRATLSIDPKFRDATTYLLISDKPDTYKYTLQVPNSRLMQGISMGREQCSIRLEKS